MSPDKDNERRVVGERLLGDHCGHVSAQKLTKVQNHVVWGCFGWSGGSSIAAGSLRRLRRVQGPTTGPGEGKQATGSRGQEALGFTFQPKMTKM